jgi:hypothetical protein
VERTTNVTDVPRFCLKTFGSRQQEALTHLRCRKRPWSYIQGCGRLLAKNSTRHSPPKEYRTTPSWYWQSVAPSCPHQRNAHAHQTKANPPLVAMPDSDSSFTITHPSTPPEVVHRYHELINERLEYH